MTTDDRPDRTLEEYLVDDRSSYVTLPTVPLPEGSEVLVGEDAWLAAMAVATRRAEKRPLVVIDVYPGGGVAAIAERIARVLP